MSSQPEREGSTAGQTEARSGVPLRRTRTGTLVVVLGVTAVVGIVTGGLYLALQRVPAAPPRTQQIGTVRVTFGTDPRVPWTGPAELKLSIVDASGTPVTNAAVTLTYDMEADSIGRRMAGMRPPGRIAAHLDAPGRYIAPVTFTLAGQWRVRVAISRMGQQEGQGEFLVTVR